MKAPHLSTARLLLGGVIIATSGFAMRYHDGHDFINNVWAPTHALLAGLNPYDPTNLQYFSRYSVPVVAGLYFPSALLLNAPLALLTPPHAADAMAALNAALIWLGVVLLVPPRTVRACLIAACAGAVLMVSAPAEHTFELGQLSGWAFAGLALFVASLRRDPSSIWLPSIGLTLVALKPQSAIPVFVALGVLGCWQLLARVAAILAVTSVPGVLLFVFAVGSPSAIVRSLSENPRALSQMPPANLANPTHIRIDALGVLSHLGGPALTGFGWTVIGFVVVTGLFVLAQRTLSQHRARTPSDSFVVTLVALYVVASLYHLTYDQLLLYVGPLAAVAFLAEGQPPGPTPWLFPIGAMTLLGAGFILRSGFQTRLVDAGIAQLPLHATWVTAPTLIAAALVGCGLAIDRRKISAADRPLCHERCGADLERDAAPTLR